MGKMGIVRTVFGCALLWIVLTSSEGGRATEDNVGSTGAPLEPQTCGNCHNSGTSFGTVSVTIQIFYDGTTTPVPAYSPGTLYDMRVTVNNTMGSPQGRGFQMTCLKFPSNTPLAGYSALASNVQQITLTTGTWAGRTYVEQPTMSVSNQFNFSWTAPPAGTGTVKFYAAGNAVNGNNSSSGDRSGSTSLTLPELLPLAVGSAVVADVSCTGANDGSIALTITGGATPYSFLWNDGITTEDRTGLAPGNYSIQITDGLGSVITGNWTINEPAPLEAEVVVTNPIFPDEDGLADFSIDGGTGPYSISINGGAGTSDTEIFLPGGNYSYVLTDDNGCSVSGSFEIVAPPSLTVQSDISHITCFGFADGVISVEISGATPPYDLLWNNGSSDSEISGLGPGTYTLTVTDAVGYVNQQSFDIIEPELLSAGALLMPIPCFGDEALVEIFGFGGTPPYNGTGIEFYGAGQYDVLVTDDNFCETIISFEMESPEPLSATATGAAIACFGDTDTIEVQAAGGTPPYSGTGEFEVTTPGDIVYQVVDNNGCVAQAVSVVTAIDGPSMSISSTFTSCATSCDGTAEVEFSNLQLPYSFVWSDGSSDEVRTDLCSGAITATLSDASGCVVESEISIGSPEPITFGYTADTLLCNGDSTLVAVVVGGNQGPVNFEWSDGATEDVLYLQAGEYVVTATDSVGCASQLQFALFQPDAIVTEVLSNDPLCATSADGGIELLVTGGTGAYTFIWNDASGDNSINGLPGGDYDYLVTDANNCSLSGTVTLTAPAPLEVSVESIINDDGTGDISLEISGGTPPFEVLWSNGSTDAALTLTTGSYTAVVTDENGCTFTAETIVVPVGLIETERDEPCFIYNAGTGMLHLTCPEFTTTRIYDVSGKQVAMTKDNWISLQGIETGLYTIVLAGNTVVQSGRFVVNGL